MRAAGRSKTAIPITLAVSAVVVAAIALTAAPRDPETSGHATAPQLATPCGGAEITSAEADATASFAVIRPDAPLAGSNDLRSMWACTTTAGGIGLVYGSGVSVLESPNDLKDPAGTWERMASSYPEFSVRELSGVPVSVADPTVGDTIGGADFVVGDVRYTVSGDGTISLEDLLAVAESLAQQAVEATLQ